MREKNQLAKCCVSFTAIGEGLYLCPHSHKMNGLMSKVMKHEDHHAGLGLGAIAKLKVKAHRVDHRVKVKLDLDADGDGDIDMVDIYNVLQSFSAPLQMNDSGAEKEAEICDRAMAAALVHLKRVPCFEKLAPRVLQRLAIGCKRVDYVPGELILEQGERPTCMSVLVVGVASQQKRERGTVARDAQPDVNVGELIGAFGVLGDIPIVATVTAATSCSVLRVNRETFRELLLPIEDTWNGHATELLYERLKTLPLFAHLTPPDLHRVSHEMGIMHFSEGRVVCAQGHHGDLMYVVLRGEVALRTDLGTEEEVEVRRIVPGDFFEERALVSLHYSHSTSAVALGAVSCAALSRDSCEGIEDLQEYMYEHYQDEHVDSAHGTPRSTRSSPTASPRVSTPGTSSAKRTATASATSGDSSVNGIDLLMAQIAKARVVVSMDNEGNDVAESRYRAVAKHIISNAELMLSNVELHKVSTMIDLQNLEEAEANLEDIVFDAFAKPAEERTRPELIAMGLVLCNSKFERTFCSGWSLDMRLKLYSKCRIEELEEGTELYRQRQRDPSRELFSIIKGTVQLHASEAATDLTAKLRPVGSPPRAGPGDMLSPTSFAGNPVRLDTVVATTQLNVIAVSAEAYHAMCIAHSLTNEALRLEAAVAVFATGAGSRFTKNWPAWAIYAVASLTKSVQLPKGVMLTEQGKLSDKIYFLIHGRLRLVTKIMPLNARGSVPKITYEQATKSPTRRRKKGAQPRFHKTELHDEGCVGLGLLNVMEQATAFITSSEARFLTLDESTFKYVKNAIGTVLSVDQKTRKQHMVKLQEALEPVRGGSSSSADSEGGSSLPEISSPKPAVTQSMSIEGRRLDRSLGGHSKESTPRSAKKTTMRSPSSLSATSGE